ncbi:hypothetical protein LP419_18655 [Massilia sp. H-1]|nr:hypothetical protein LP419_18655 [Massilia sp. H-1]
MLWLPMRLKALLWRMVKRSGAAALTPSSSDSSYEFDPRWLDKRSSLFSRLVLRHASHGRIVSSGAPTMRRWPMRCPACPVA